MNRRAPKAANGVPGQVRIIGGRWRGSRLPVVDGAGLRPTSDRGRETLFNWLQPMLPGARVLDLFAGSGALGLEALSRGAREVFLLEHAPRAAEALRASCARLHAGEAARVLQVDALRWLTAPLHGRFDLVFVDPPFADGLWPEVLRLLPAWTSESAWLYLETPAAMALEAGPGWHLHRELGSRDSRMALYRRAQAAAATLAADFNADGAATE